MRISPGDFEFVRQLVHDRAAIVLEPGKEYLVESRLGPLALRQGCRTLKEFIGRMRAEVQAKVLQCEAIDALTTNETLFFRDHHPFEALRREILPVLLKSRLATRRLSIWSAACSTGQEPYSIAMLLTEYFPELADWTVSILATDLSPTVLASAQRGVFSQIEVNRGVPPAFLMKYFQKVGPDWRIVERISRMIQFRPMNLAAPWPALPQFDLVFMRNVMIYFDCDTKRTILQSVRSCLRPDGYLLLGTAETTFNLDPVFVPVSFGKSVVYRVPA